MEQYKISLDDISSNYFHFTRKSNLESIEEKGLLPRISFHAKYLEDTPKVFFVQGLDHLLILLDCWIHVCTKYPLIPGLFHLGTRMKGKNIFSKSLVHIYFKWTQINPIHKFVAYQYFDRFLKRYILLNVDIKEDVDFSFDDIDQIKAKGYDKDFLIKGGYSLLYSDLETTKMDKWNLHTYTNHGIASSKLKICSINHSCEMINILTYAINHAKLELDTICPVLYGYLKDRKWI